MTQIIIGIIAGALLATIAPTTASAFSILGTLFVGGLKAVAPILVFFLVASSLANHKKGTQTNLRPVLILYMFGTFAAALTAVVMSFLFPTTLTLVTGVADATPPDGIIEVIQTLLFKIVDNPVNALQTGNFVGILAWAIAIGMVLRHVSDQTKQVMADISIGVSGVVKFVIRLAPFGIFGLVAATVSTRCKS